MALCRACPPLLQCNREGCVTCHVLPVPKKKVHTLPAPLMFRHPEEIKAFTWLHLSLSWIHLFLFELQSLLSTLADYHSFQSPGCSVFVQQIIGRNEVIGARVESKPRLSWNDACCSTGRRRRASLFFYRLIETLCGGSHVVFPLITCRLSELLFWPVKKLDWVTEAKGQNIT